MPLGAKLQLDGRLTIERPPASPATVGVAFGTIATVGALAHLLATIQGDVIEGVVAANHLSGEPADRFRSAAWTALEGSGATAPGSRTAVESARLSRASRAVGRVA